MRKHWWLYWFYVDGKRDRGLSKKLAAATGWGWEEESFGRKKLLESESDDVMS